MHHVVPALRHCIGHGVRPVPLILNHTLLIGAPDSNTRRDLHLDLGSTGGNLPAVRILGYDSEGARRASGASGDPSASGDALGWVHGADGLQRKVTAYAPSP
ncbi:hypothetical protein C4D60_Mb06t28580 [Musa balbisiana]|uniref:Uncharacterized protein n=1 Tax=Musa balbisiana TaxID=52838 RepID=A0A4S8IRC1_MUSBA|nr:hypothetical protein C4D60_Mb06t28580 [Musa balbisiana]